MNVGKRNGLIVEFNMDKVVNAIHRACLDVEPEMKLSFAEEVAADVYEAIKEHQIVKVEEIQDIVEEKLMVRNLKIAKSYILYRNEKNKNRGNKKRYKLLSSEFLSQYKHRTPPLNALGNFVFYRTYSRFLPEEGRREFWYETLARAVDYNCSLSKNTTREEAEELYDNLFNLKQQLSGRTLYTGNTKASLLYPLSNFNCSFLVIDKIDSFADLFYVLMVGTGAGTTVQAKYSELLPPFRTDVNMFHEEWEFTPKEFREEITTSEVNGDTLKIVIGDSKEGFMEALRLYMNILTNNSYRTINNIIVNYNYIRPKGERLVTFGGTASGHGNMKNMLHKINKVIAARKSEGEKIKLESIDVVDIANIIGENVVSGGVRRTAELILIDSDDEKSKLAKANLYQPDETGEWKLNEAISHRSVSNNSVIYESKPTRESLHEHIKMMRYSGEPGMINAEAARKRRPNFKGVNPCFTGDMKLLTEAGYKTFESLEDQTVRMVNKDGKITEGKVWSSGIKDIFEIKFSDGKRITSTDNHVFMTNDGQEVEAKDLKRKRVMPYLNVQSDHDLEFVKLGFLQGDGNLTRLSSETHRGLEINIGEKDGEIRDLFGLTGTDRTEYINGYNEKMKSLGFSEKILPERVLPSTIGAWNDIKVRSFLRGLFSANGCVLNAGRIAFKTTNKEMAEQMKELLLVRFNIVAYITVNKSKKVTFSNGEYECRESYDLNIQRYESRKTFYSIIGFVHEYKTEKLKDALIAQSPMVMNVTNTGRTEKVYDFHEPELHWGVVEGVIAHNCGEILLDADSVCNLTTNNVAAFIENGILNMVKLKRAIVMSVRAGYRMTLLRLELPHWDRTHKRDRLLGVSMTGYQDAVTSIDMSLEDQKIMLEELRMTAHNAMKEIAKEEGLGESLLITTIKPEGTISQVMGGVSSGLHFSHSEYFIRRIRISANDALVKVCQDLGWTIHNEDGQTDENCDTKVIDFPIHSPAKKFKKDVTAIEQLEIYKMFQTYYTDHNTSNTVHVRDDEWDGVEEWLWENWDEFIGVSFLSESDSFYQLMPYEAIDKETYEKMVASMKEFNPSMLKKYETSGESELDAETCASGGCAVR